MICSLISFGPEALGSGALGKGKDEIGDYSADFVSWGRIDMSQYL